MRRSRWTTSCRRFGHESRHVLAVAAQVEASWDALAADPAVVIDADAVEQAIGMLDQGDVRVAGPDGQGEWLVHAWAKQAVLLYFRVRVGGHRSRTVRVPRQAAALKHGYDELGVRVDPPQPLATARTCHLASCSCRAT